MATVDEVLALPRPASIDEARARWPWRERYTPSPVDWRDECLYFFLPDRFSDSHDRPLLDRARLDEARGATGSWDDAAWRAWAESGRTRFQGGTLAGARSRLGYLADLGVTALWIGPVWKQRKELFVNDDGQRADEYHGYAIQDFFDVDQRFGSRRDLVELVAAAHDRGIRVIFDIIVNHTARNWLYHVDGAVRKLADDPFYVPGAGPYEFGAWLDENGGQLPEGAAPGPDDAVWPRELQKPGAYHRRGQIREWGGALMDPGAQFRLGDMFSRDLDLGGPDGEILQAMISCWTYWLALTDCDGFRIDTLKHTGIDEARRFCGAVREFAEALGKQNFLLAGEVAQGDPLAGPDTPPQFRSATWAQAYLDLLGQNLTAALEIGGPRQDMRRAAARNDGSAAYLERYNNQPDPLPVSHRTAGACFVTLLDDHDDLGDHRRFPQVRRVDPPGADDRDADSFCHPLQCVPGVALMLLGLGVPCLYYGTEQGMTGAALRDPGRLPSWGAGDHGGDRYLREAMFGPAHPRPLGSAGRPAVPGGPTEDADATGFGPFGTAGRHLFDPQSPVYRRIRALLAVRRAHTPLRSGRQYARPATLPAEHPAGGAVATGIMAWSRIQAWQEAVVVVNTNPPSAGGAGLVTAQVLVDIGLNPPGTAKLRVAASTAQCDNLAPALAVDTLLDVQVRDAAYVVVPDLPPHEVVVLVREPLR